MAKDRKFVQHIHSSVPDKQPTPATLEPGELAVNNSANQEFISFKNTEDKVVRVSSDAQLVTWMEKKAVIPYSGTVENVHLDTNKSNIELKFNQVAASNTKFYDKINGAKDIDNELVNPSSDGGLTNGAGFAIDTSAFALIGANPSFSSVTTDCKTTLNGTTEIHGATGGCGSLLDITVDSADTDVKTATTNVTAATTTIGTATTTVGTANTTATTTNYSGDALTLTENTIDVKSCTRISAITNNYQVKECAAGGSVGISSTTVNVSGTNLNINESNTTISSCGKFEVESNDISFKQCASGTGGSLTFEQCTKFGVKTNDFSVEECTANAGKFGISSTTGSISGKTLDIVENTSLTEKSPTITISGGTSISAITPTLVASGSTLNVNEGTVNVSGLTGGVNVSGSDICLSAATATCVYGSSLTNVGKSCAGAITQESNVIGGNVNVSATATTVCVSAKTDADVYGESNTKVGISCAGDVSERTYVRGEDIIIDATTKDLGITAKEDILQSAEGDIIVTADKKICINAGEDTIIYGQENTKIGIDCSGSVASNTTTIYGGDVNVSGGSVDIISTSSTVCVSANTNASLFGKTKTTVGASCDGNALSNETDISGKTINIYSTGNTNITANTFNISGDTNITGTINPSSGLSKTLSWSYGTVTGASNGSTNFKSDASFTIPKDASHITRKTLSIDYLDCNESATGYTDTTYDPGASSNATLHIPRHVANLGRAKLDFQYGPLFNNGSATYSGGTYDPGEKCDNTSSDKIVIPRTIEDLLNASGECISISGDVCVDGIVSATGGMYTSSDEVLKENINYLGGNDMAKSRKVVFKTFNFKNDESKRKMYGVIAQDVEAAGLEELVHYDSSGIRSVDYTGLLVLKLAELEYELKKTKEELDNLKTRVRYK